jgi:hypothetical protein
MMQIPDDLRKLFRTMYFTLSDEDMQKVVDVWEKEGMNVHQMRMRVRLGVSLPDVWKGEKQ